MANQRAQGASQAGASVAPRPMPHEAGLPRPLTTPFGRNSIVGLAGRSLRTIGVVMACFGIMALLVVEATSVNEAAAQAPAVKVMSPVRYTVRPRVQSLIAMKTLPGGVCTLRSDGDPKSKGNGKLFADPEGMIRFYVCPEAESAVVKKFVIDCQVDGKVTAFPLELRASSKATADMPAPPAQNKNQVPKGAQARPALSAGDALRLSDQELKKRGFPFRPDPKGAPKAFAAWRKLVSTPTTVIKPHTVARADIGPTRVKAPTKVQAKLLTDAVNPPIFDATHCGYLVTAPSSKVFTNVSGFWQVPSITPTSFRDGTPANSDSLIYVALNWAGDGTTFVAAGTQQFVTIQQRMPFTQYQAWFSTPTSTQLFTNFPIQPGDEVYITISLNSSGTVSFGFGKSFIFAAPPEQRLGTSQVAGRNAAFILERPMVFKGPPVITYPGLLARFDSVALLGLIGTGPGAGFPWKPGDARSSEYRMTDDGKSTGQPLAHTIVDPSTGNLLIVRDRP
jgi:hypothetical protein